MQNGSSLQNFSSPPCFCVHRLVSPLANWITNEFLNELRLNFRFLLSIFCYPSAQNIASEEATVLNQLLAGYDKRFPPPGEKAILVRTNLFIRSIEKISTFDMQMTAQLTHRRTYTDSRLSFSNETGLDWVTVRDPSVLWTPDSFFSNGFSLETHNQIATIRPTGEVFLSERISGTFDCPMNLMDYPFDVQICFLQIGSCKLGTPSACLLNKKNVHLLTFY